MCGKDGHLRTWDTLRNKVLEQWLSSLATITLVSGM